MKLTANRPMDVYFTSTTSRAGARATTQHLPHVPRRPERAEMGSSSTARMALANPWTRIKIAGTMAASTVINLSAERMVVAATQAATAEEEVSPEAAAVDTDWDSRLWRGSGQQHWVVFAHLKKA